MTHSIWFDLSIKRSMEYQSVGSVLDRIQDGHQVLVDWEGTDFTTLGSTFCLL